MSTNKLNKKLIKNAKNRELLYAEAQEKAISKQVVLVITGFIVINN